jgi:hypothetical protein
MVNPIQVRDWLLSWFDHSDILRTIDGKLFVYMRRHKLLTTKLGEVRIHEIMLSDQDEFLHDHPFNFVSIMLAGSYEETWRDPVQHVTPIDYSTHVEVRSALSVRYVPATRLHKLRLVGGGKVWTLVLTGPRNRQWGFAHGEHWKPWDEFVNVPDGYSEISHATLRDRINRRVRARVHQEPIDRSLRSV